MIATLVLAHLLVGDKLFPTDPTTFTGTGWNGIVFDHSTDADIKKLFLIEKGPIRPEGMNLGTDNGNIRDVHVLLDGRGGKARAIGFALELPVAVKDSELTTQLGETPEKLYSSDRYGDYVYLYYPNRGVLATGLAGEVSHAVLTSPKLAKVAAKPFSAEVTELRDREILERKERVIEVGDVDVSFSFTRMSLTRQSSAQNDIEEDIERWRFPRTIDWRRGSQGKIVVNVSGSFDRKKFTTSVSVSTRVEGTTHLGPVTGYANITNTWKEREGSADPVWTSPRPINRMIEDSLDDAIRSLNKNIDKQRVPSAREFAEAEWMRVINDAIR